MLTFTVHGVAQPAGSKRGFHRGGRVIITDANAKSRPWKAQVTDAGAAAMGGAALLDGPLSLELVFYIPRPKGHYGTGRNAGTVRASAPAFPAVKPDVLKLARAVEDALTGIAYRDDAQIVQERLVKRYGEPARVEVVIDTAHDHQQTLDHQEVEAA